VIVEIFDSAQRITNFLETSVASLMQHGMLTLERAHVMMTRHDAANDPRPLELGSLIPPLSTVPRIEASSTMQIQENGVLLRVFIGESDRWEHKPLHEAILQHARQLGLGGATVLRGVEGFGAHSVVHKAQLLEMSTDLPIVVEMVDSEEKIRLLLPGLETMVREGMITMEHVIILLRSPGESKSSAPR
jgi:hypothetical protein